jgi:tRNA A37 threonylcarbamoyladenosine dehydratase
MIVGLGGVGSYVAEFIARNGVGEMTIMDGAMIDPTNRNRQLVALATNQGEYKADVMEARLMSINPQITVTCYKKIYKSRNSC